MLYECACANHVNDPVSFTILMTKCVNYDSATGDVVKLFITEVKIPGKNLEVKEGRDLFSGEYGIALPY